VESVVRMQTSVQCRHHPPAKCRKSDGARQAARETHRNGYDGRNTAERTHAPQAAHRSHRSSGQRPMRQAGLRAHEGICAIRLPVPKAQWLYGSLRLAYRCGGSAGIADRECGCAPDFPFPPLQRTLRGAPEASAGYAKCRGRVKASAAVGVRRPLPQNPDPGSGRGSGATPLGAALAATGSVQAASLDSGRRRGQKTPPADPRVQAPAAGRTPPLWERACSRLRPRPLPQRRCTRPKA